MIHMFIGGNKKFENMKNVLNFQRKQHRQENICLFSHCNKLDKWRQRVKLQSAEKTCFAIREISIYGNKNEWHHGPDLASSERN